MIKTRRLGRCAAALVVLLFSGCRSGDGFFNSTPVVPAESVMETLCAVKASAVEWRDVALANIQENSREHQRAGELHQCLKVRFNAIVELAEYDAVRKRANDETDYETKVQALLKDEEAFVSFVEDVYLRQEFETIMNAHRRALEESTKGFVDHWTFQQYTNHFNKMLDDRKLNFSMDIPVKRILARFVSLWNRYSRARGGGSEKLVKFYQSLAMDDFQ